ncbi:MAG: hypothetical protein JO199_07880, partial [Candidatus Eremiobacteraeota bacterium]|nr:hypothetical protein [Candidatus Eremiobacteraeota bacterium]
MIFVRPQTEADVPRAHRDYIDIHLLDMNHAWQNAGHDSIVALVERLST